MKELFVVETRSKAVKLKFVEQPVVKSQGHTAEEREDEFGRYHELYGTVDIGKAEVVSVSDY